MGVRVFSAARRLQMPMNFEFDQPSTADYRRPDFVVSASQDSIHVNGRVYLTMTKA